MALVPGVSRSGDDQRRPTDRLHPLLFALVGAGVLAPHAGELSS
ncbi:hypothetical protein ABZ545_05380 [Streptomyces abikoensis]